MICHFTVDSGSNCLNEILQIIKENRRAAMPCKVHIFLAAGTPEAVTRNVRTLMQDLREILGIRRSDLDIRIVEGQRTHRIHLEKIPGGVSTQMKKSKEIDSKLLNRLKNMLNFPTFAGSQQKSQEYNEFLSELRDCLVNSLEELNEAQENFVYAGPFRIGSIIVRSQDPKVVPYLRDVRNRGYEQVFLKFVNGMITETLSRFPNLNIDNCSEIRIEPASRVVADSNDKFEFEFLEAVQTSEESGPASSAALLVTVRDAEGTREYTIESFPGIVGREGSGADIPVFHAGVSRSHLRIEADREGKIAVTDTDSRNGTYYDGKLMKCGTKYQISASVTQFTLCIGRTCSPDVSRKNALSGDNSRFPCITISMPQAESQFTPLVESEFNDQATPLVSLGYEAVSVEIEDATGSRIVPIQCFPVVMGRECDGIVLSGKYPSREHLEIVSTSDTGVVIRDIGSSNGTYLQGARLSAMEEHSIPFDTLISLGPEEHSAKESPKLCFRR